MIRVIAFDLDDTLWDVRPVIMRAEAELDLFLKSRVPSLKYDIESMRALRAPLLQSEPALAGQITELRRRVIEVALHKSGVASGAAYPISVEAIEVFLTHRNRIELFDGAREALAQLADRFLVGALSNGNADVKRLGLDAVFSFAFSAEDVGAPKPATNLFLAAMKHTGAAAEEIVYVGDDPRMDMDPAKLLGLHTIWLNRAERSMGSVSVGVTKPDETISHISDVTNAVDRLVGRTR